MTIFHPATPADIPWFNVNPGDTINLMGAHGSQSWHGLKIKKSGEENAPITIKGIDLSLMKYYIKFDGCSHIVLDGINIRHCGQIRGEGAKNITIRMGRFEDLDEINIRFIELHPGNDDWKILDCLFVDIPNPVYSLIDGGIIGAERVTVEGCAAVRTYFPDRDTDCHFVGLQGGNGHVIRRNYTENTGSAVVLWTPKEAKSQNNRIEANFLTHAKPITNGSSGSLIEISGKYKVADDLPKKGWRSGNVVKGNWGRDAVYGLRAVQARDEIIGANENYFWQCEKAKVLIENPWEATQ